MQTQLLQSIGCVRWGENETGEVAPASQWKTSDGAYLPQILFSLASLHKQRGSALGNITDRSLRRAPDGRPILVCDPREPSICEQTKKGADDGRFFVNLGEKPEEIDDLVSLGVALAEMLIAPAQRPELTANHESYRRELAERLPRRHGLVKGLLLSHDPLGYQTSAKFIEDRIGLVALTVDGGSRPTFKVVRGWDILRYKLQVALGITVAIVVSLLALGALWQTAKGELKTASDKLTASENKVRSTEEALGEKTKLLDICRDRPQPPDPEPVPGSIDNWIEKDPRHVVFKNDPFLNSKARFVKLLQERTISNEESEYAKALLESISAASKVWWQLVDNSSSDKEVKQIIQSQAPAVREVLDKWYADTMLAKGYFLTLKASAVPSNYDDYSFRLTINDSLQNENVERRLVAKNEVFKSVDQNSIQIPIRWKSGQPVTVWLEYWSSWKLNWMDLKTDYQQGELSLIALASKKISFDGFMLQFSVDPLPGPPVGSRNPSPIILWPRPSSDSFPANGNGGSSQILISPVDELK